jgi:HPt (histidine-containing phosphotransfer) domain-containing protein
MAHDAAVDREGGVEGWLDEEKWQSLVLDLEDDLPDLVSTFCQDVVFRIQEMNSALGKGDFKTIGRLAHSLKSSSGIFGARQMIACCIDIETAAKTRSANLQGLIHDLSEIFRGTEKQLKDRV